MKPAPILLVAAIVLLGAAGLSLWRGRTPGLYGVMEPRTSAFFWIIVGAYLLLGGLSLIFAIRSFLR